MNNFDQSVLDYTARSDTYLKSNAMARSSFGFVKHKSRQEDIDYMLAIDELSESDIHRDSDD